MIRKLVVILCASCTLLWAQPDEALDNNVTGGGPGNPSARAPLPADADLFVGTSINGTTSSHNAFAIDVDTGLATPVLDLFPVWGATTDIANGRILITSTDGVGANGSAIYEFPLDGATATQLGNIMDAAGGTFRIDGLAIANGVLYGSRAAALSDGLYAIDMTTWVATLVFAYGDSISGIDADPMTNIIYGVNDTTGELVIIDPVGMTITPVVAYPDPNETDIDGLAVGGGKAYLIPDDGDPNLIYVYDIASGTFDPPVPAPWTLADTFSGGAYIGAIVMIPTMGKPILILMVVLLAVMGVVLIRRRSQASA